jgi:molybdopterin molybdotransferase
VTVLAFPVLQFEDARHQVEEHVRTVRLPAKEQVTLLAATGRVLAQEITCDRDLPPFPRATRDGFAVRAEDVSTVPVSLRTVAEIHAGMDVSGIRIGPGECAEIMTGAAVPEGANAVVMVEYTASAERIDTPVQNQPPRTGVSAPHNHVEVQRAVVDGENVVPRGAEARDGQTLLKPGARLTPAAVAIAASVGLPELQVFQQPRVAILATGDELVAVAANPLPHQIRNSNTYSLAAQVSRAGAVPVPLPVAPDEESALRDLIEQGLECNLLLLSGGVSMGKYDLVEKVLGELGAEFPFTGVAIQPGKPTVFGLITWKGETKYFFGLPGNPVSTMVTFELFARPMIEGLSGAGPSPLRYSTARLKAELRTKTGLTRFLPAELSGEFGSVQVELVRWQGSGDMVATARANCLAVIPPDREKIAAGEMISVVNI